MGHSIMGQKMNNCATPQATSSIPPTNGQFLISPSSSISANKFSLRTVENGFCPIDCSTPQLVLATDDHQDMLTMAPIALNVPLAASAVTTATRLFALLEG